MSQNDPNFVPVQEELIGIHALNPFLREVTSSRAVMFSNFLTQLGVLTTPKSPIIQSGNESQLRSNTFSCMIEKDSWFLGMVDRYSGLGADSVSDVTESVIIYKNHDTGTIDFTAIPTNFSLHTTFGFNYVRNNEAIDRCRYDDFIPAGTIVADTPGAIGDSDYGYGTVANMALPSIVETTGDGFVISDSFARDLGHTTYEKRVINLGEDRFGIDIHGNDEIGYKSFLGIGEMIPDDRVLMVLRNKETMMAPALHSKSDLREFDPNFDEAVYVSETGGRVADLKIYKNSKTRKHMFTGTDEGLEKYVVGLQKYYSRILAIYDDAKKDHYRETGSYDLPVSPAFSRLIIEALASTSNDSTLKYTYKNEPIDTYRMEYLIEYNHVCAPPGTKLSTIQGGKGVVVEIRPQHLMPKDSNGVYADIIMDPTSFDSRMNIGSLYEMEFAGISRKARAKVMAKLGTKLEVSKATDAVISECMEIITTTLEVFGTPQTSAYKNATPDQCRGIAEEVVGSELYLFYTISNKKRPYAVIVDAKKAGLCSDIENLEFDAYGKPVKSRTGMIIAPMYIMLLARSPTAFSSCPSAKTNHYGLPIGVTASNRDRYPSTNSPTKVLSETDTRILVNYTSPEALAEIRDRSNSISTHKSVYRGVLDADVPTNIDSLIDRTKTPYGGDKALEFVENLFNVSGGKFTYVKGK